MDYFFLFSKFKRLGLSQVGVLSGVAMQEIWNSKLPMMSQASSFGLQDGKLTIFLTNFWTASWVQFPDRSIDQNYGKSGTSGRSNLAQRGKLALPNDYAVVAIGEDTEWDGLPKDREVTNEVGAILGNFRLYSACRRQS